MQDPIIRSVVNPLLQSLRPRQWPKNLFVLAPLVFARQLGDPRLVLRAFSAFLLFAAASSAIYLVNDLLDREKDRLHPLKRLRPLAAGALSVKTAVLTALALALVATAGGALLGLSFSAILIGYVVLNLLYSSVLKRVVILDVMAVSLGYVFRVWAGGAAIDVEVSPWLLLCTTFLALFLTFSKRRHEIELLADNAAEQREVLTRYSPLFLDQMINVVTTSSLMSYTLYAIAPATVEKFQTQALIYTIPFVLFGIFRYLYLIHQAPQKRNPTEAILYDPPFLVNLFLWTLAVVWVIYLR